MNPTEGSFDDRLSGQFAPFDHRRHLMVTQQLEGHGRHITHPGVLRAMARIPRHEFVPDAEQRRSYDDGALLIGCGQTISQPYIVALMTELLDPKPGEKVLEVGTGSGYQAAVLSELGAKVYSIEIVEPLATKARETLRRLGFTNIRIKLGDGYFGWPEFAPYDAIIVTCAPASPPIRLIDQLRDGGRMVIPTGTAHAQELFRLEKRNDRITCEAVLPVRFVPMIGEADQASSSSK